jgi:O-antigen/teichoic acid export membrane protein
MNISNLKRQYKTIISSRKFSEILWVTIGQIITLALNFLIIKLLSKLGAQEYGKYALVLTIVSLVSLIYYGPITQGFIRFFYHYQYKNLLSEFVNLMYKFIIYSSIVLSLFTFIAAVLSKTLTLYNSFFFILASGIFVVTFKSDEFFSSSLNVVRKRRENSLLQGGEKIVIVLLLLFLIKKNYLQLNFVFVSLAIIALLITFTKYYFFNKVITNNMGEKITNLNLHQKEMRDIILKYSSPFLIWGIAGWIQLNSEKWIIAKFLTTADVGIYAIMMALVNALIILPNTIVSEFSTPIIFQNFSDFNDKSKLETGYKYIHLIIIVILIMTILAVILTFFFGYSLIKIISSSEYAVYWYLLPVLCIGTGMFYIGQAMCNVGMALNQPQKYIVPKVVTGIIAVFLNIILITVMGLKGIAFSVLLVGIIYFIYIRLINRELLNSVKQ